MSSAQAAAVVIKNAIEAASGPLPPEFLVQFLLDDWRRYLALTHRDHGEYSEEWRAAITASDLLLWSVAPKNTEEEKADMTKSLPALISSVKKGMNVAGLTPEAQSVFLRKLSEWQVGLIAGKAGKDNDAAASDKAMQELDPSDTVQLNVADLRYRELMDMLDNADVQKIDI